MYPPKDGDICGIVIRDPDKEFLRFIREAQKLGEPVVIKQFPKPEYGLGINKQNNTKTK